MKVRLEIGRSIKEYEVISQPYPHILIDTRKELHGWWKGKRECTGERLLINPYNGCSFRCLFCYVKGFPWSYFKLWDEKGIITVCRNFDKVVAHQLDAINVASPGYLSPVTDPFQPINLKYRLTEKIITEFVSRNIPIEFITKGVVSDEAIGLIKLQKHSFGQVSILTLNEELRKILVPGGASTSSLLNNLKRLASSGIYAVTRIDPILPYITDKRKELEELILRVVDAGASHIIASSLDIPKSIHGYVMNGIKQFGVGLVYEYRRLYSELIDSYYNASIVYRKSLFTSLREICDKHQVTFALCMEYELRNGHPIGLNKEFMSSANCEGMDIPIYVRHGSAFQEATECSGTCLLCKKARCEIQDLAMGRDKDTKKDWHLSDYKRWGQLDLWKWATRTKRPL